MLQDRDHFHFYKDRLEKLEGGPIDFRGCLYVIQHRMAKELNYFPPSSLLIWEVSGSLVIDASFLLKEVC